MLHRTGGHRLWVLNVTAATLWCLMDGQTATAALARDYGARFRLDPAAARRDVYALLNQFGQWGLLKGKDQGNVHQEEIGKPLEPLAVEKRLEEDISGLPRMAFSLAGHSFGVTFDDPALEESCRDLFRHLAGADDPAATELAVLKHGADQAKPFYGYQDGLAVEAGLAAEEVIPFLVTQLFAHRMTCLDHCLLFHGAVVARDGQALLLPAPSGSGKSTLSAALTVAGWACLGDELAVVNPEPLSVDPLALPIGLKDRSMKALAPFLPGLDSRPRYTRVDGVGVRYLTPPKAPPATSLPLKALVFPSYGTDASTTLTTLPPLTALERLAESGSSARPLVSADIQAMLKMAALPSYRLEFSSLEDALDLLNGVI